jgi:CheY-like chemotaxis protein
MSGLQLAGPSFRSAIRARFPRAHPKGGSPFANVPLVPHATPKTVEIAAPKNSLTPCVLEEDPVQLDALASLIAELGYQCVPTSDPEEAIKALRYGRCRLMLAGIHGSNTTGATGAKGYEFLDRALRTDPGLHLIVVTSEYTLDSALEAIRRGAADFLPKPIDRNRLKRTLDDVAALYDQRRRVRALEKQLLKDLDFHGIIGKSPAMLEVFDFARKVARHYSNVLVVGATGTGKELVARAIHQISPVSSQSWRCATARRWSIPCSKASCSATCAAPSPAPPTPARGCSNTPMAARSFSTKSGKLR